VTGLVDEFRSRYRALRGQEPELQPGATEADIAAAETALGVRLPEDLRALYRVADGAWQSSGLLSFWDLWSVAGLPEEYHEGRPGSYGWYDDPLDNSYVVFDAGPPGHVRQRLVVTIASDSNGNYLAVDLDPDVDGGYGQVLTSLQSCRSRINNHATWHTDVRVGSVHIVSAAAPDRGRVLPAGTAFRRGGRVAAGYSSGRGRPSARPSARRRTGPRR
jgi:cell wall assembly regulator SMI1